MALATPKLTRAEAVRELFAILPQLRRRFQAELPEDLSQELCRVTPHQGETLYLLNRAGPAGLSMNELARHQGCALSTATAMADRLLKLGLAERMHDEEDRRVVRIATTERGRDLTQRFAELKHRVFLDAVERLSDDEVITLVQLLHKVLGETATAEVQS